LPTETLELAGDGARVLVTVTPNAGPNAVIYFGGNAEDVGSSLPSLVQAFPDHALYLMHYRGYGGSSGKPTEAALVADAAVLFDRVSADHESISVIGRSLGSGVAVQLASQRPVARLALITPYNSILELGERQFPFLPISWLLQDRFESWRYAEKITAPTLLLAAENDAIIPGSSTQALLKHFPKGIAKLVVVPGVGHNSISESTDYVRLLGGVN